MDKTTPSHQRVDDSADLVELATRRQRALQDGKPPAHTSGGTAQLQEVTAAKHLRTRQQIAAWVREHPGGTPTEIATGLGLGADRVKKSCRRMVRDGQLRSTPGGAYYPGPATVSPEVG